MRNHYIPRINRKLLKSYKDPPIDHFYDGGRFINMSLFPEITGPILVMSESYKGKGRGSIKRQRGSN